VATGGHYRPEPIDDLAAIIADSDSYIPLSMLRGGPFYGFQHETSTWRPDRSSSSDQALRVGHVSSSCTARRPARPEFDDRLAEALYGKTYAELEAEWLGYLDSLSPTAEQAESWGFNVRYFDLMRRYQTDLDPDARILPGITHRLDEATPFRSYPADGRAGQRVF